MKRKTDKNTRYFIDINLENGSIIHTDFQQKEILSKQELENPSHFRLFISKGQFNKLEKKMFELHCNIEPA